MVLTHIVVPLTGNHLFNGHMCKRSHSLTCTSMHSSVNGMNHAFALYCQNGDERNYHIFYCMLAGMSAAEKSALHLTTATDYYYLTQVKFDLC